MSAIPPSSGPIPLDYAPAPPRWRKRARYILLALILLAAGFCAWRWGPYAWKQSHLLYWQRQCLNFSASPDTVVYEEEPAAAILLRRSDYSPHVTVRREDFDTDFNIVQVKAAAFYPRCWRRLDTFATLPTVPFFPSDGDGAIIFLHERVSSAGHRRLVCVDYAPKTFSPQFAEGVNCFSCVISPATWIRPLTEGPRIDCWNMRMPIYPPPPPLVRVYSGQIDPADPAQFTIRYQMWGQEDVLDGRLQDDDSVTLTPRHEPEWPSR